MTLGSCGRIDAWRPFRHSELGCSGQESSFGVDVVELLNFRAFHFPWFTVSVFIDGPQSWTVRTRAAMNFTTTLFSPVSRSPRREGLDTDGNSRSVAAPQLRAGRRMRSFSYHWALVAVVALAACSSNGVEEPQGSSAGDSTVPSGVAEPADQTMEDNNSTSVPAPGGSSDGVAAEDNNSTTVPAPEGSSDGVAAENTSTTVPAPEHRPTELRERFRSRHLS